MDENFAEQLAHMVRQLTRSGLTGAQWGVAFGFIVQKLKERRLDASVVDGRELQVRFPVGDCALTVSICARPIPPWHVGPAGPPVYGGY
jgi:hypothetical protein